MTTGALDGDAAPGWRDRPSGADAAVRTSAPTSSSSARFSYLIGFVGNWVVPKGIDDGTPAASTGAAVAASVLLLGLFAVQHTIMARPAFKEIWTRWVPWHVERSTFVPALDRDPCAHGLAVAPAARARVADREPASRRSSSGLSLAGWGIVLVSTFLIDHFELFGLKQTVSYAMGRPHRTSEVQERLFYRWVRHPLMLGFLIAFWATPAMSQGHLLFAARDDRVHSGRHPDRGAYARAPARGSVPGLPETRLDAPPVRPPAARRGVAHHSVRPCP